MTYVSEVLADNPLGYWRHGDPSGTTMTDSSGNGRNGTHPATNMTLGAASLLVGDADTSADYASTATSNGISVVADAAWMDVTTMSIEAIINPDTLSGSSYNFIASRDQSSFGPFWFVVHGGELELAVWINGLSGPRQVTGVQTLTAGNTYHVVGTYDGANVKLYVNGNLDKTEAHAGTLNAGTHPIRIGNWITSNLPFNGRIDEVAYYGTALSGARVLAHYNASVTLPPQNVALGQATETDTAQALTKTLTLSSPLGQASEADSAGSLATATYLPLGRAEETSSAGRLYKPLVTPFAYEQSDDFFFGRYKVKVGVSLIKRDGHYEEVQYPWLGELVGEEGRDFFLGGHTYTDIAEDVRADLAADGYET